jgi:hypothetical protein
MVTALCFGLVYLLISVAGPHHFYAAPVPSKNFDAAPTPPQSRDSLRLRLRLNNTAFDDVRNTPIVFFF